MLRLGPISLNTDNATMTSIFSDRQQQCNVRAELWSTLHGASAERSTSTGARIKVSSGKRAGAIVQPSKSIPRARNPGDPKAPGAYED